MPDGIFIDANALLDLAADLERTAEGIGVAVPEELAGGGKLIATRAASFARSYTSVSSEVRPNEGETREAVANSIRVRKGPSEVRVEAGDVALSGLWEMGNARSNAEKNTFRHPTFGRKDDWHEQPKWPFLRMALNEVEPEMIGRIAKVIDSVFSRFGFR